MNPFHRLAAVFLAVGVIFGAFGAHALKETLLANESLDTWKTAVFYHLLHGLALGVVPAWASFRAWKGWLIIAGIVCFSGSLYLLALKVPPSALWGPVTPLGGVLFIMAWISLCFGNRLRNVSAVD